MCPISAQTGVKINGKRRRGFVSRLRGLASFRSADNALHDIELLATVGMLDDLPPQPFIKPGCRVGSVQINCGMTQVARMGFDSANERLAQPATSMAGLYKQSPQIGPVRGAILRFSFVQGNRADSFAIQNGDQGRRESALAEMGFQPARDGFDGSVRF